jgi:hypothetical protein
MGVFVQYSAIPPSSSLYNRLRTNFPLRIIFYYTFHYGGAPYQFFNTARDEIAEILESFIEYAMETYPIIFPSETEVEILIAEFRSELRLTCSAFPGIEARGVSWDGGANDIIDSLPSVLISRQVENSETLAKQLIFGDKLLRNEESNFGLEVISRQLVERGASIFRQIDSEDAFSDRDSNDYAQYTFDLLKEIYMLADQHNEEIIPMFH